MPADAPFTFTPYGDRIAVKVKRVDESRGGIKLPSTGKQVIETVTATVMAVGPDVKQLKVGDIVSIGDSVSCQVLRYKDVEWGICWERDVQGVLVE